LLAGLSGAEIEGLLPALDSLRTEPGTPLVRAGDPAEELFLVVAGTLSVYASVPGGRGRRLSTLSAGMAFGEVAFVERGTRTADVFADSAVECLRMPYSLLDRLATDDPVLHGKLLRNILALVGASLRRANAEAAQPARRSPT